jgi:hypothetical protein
VAAVVDRSILLCGDCFYRNTVEHVMSAAFIPGTTTMASLSGRPAAAPERNTSAPTR